VITESYGDLTRQSIEEVWHGEKLAALRAALQTDEPPASCVTCPLYGWVPLES
jgi:hypothetical protein